MSSPPLRSLLPVGEIELAAFHTESYGASATTLRGQVAGGRPISALYLLSKSLENTVTDPSRANMLAQLADTITVLKGNKPIYQGDPDDLAILQEKITGRAIDFHTGGGTDNRQQYITLVIPFGRYMGGQDIISGFADKDFALLTKSTIGLDVVVPADANNLDGRTLKAFVVYNDFAKPKGFIERVAKTITKSGAGWQEALHVDPDEAMGLYDALFFQTTELSAGVTADTTTIEAVQIYVDGVMKSLKGDVDEELFAALAEGAGTVGAPDDEYLYKSWKMWPGGFLPGKDIKFQVNYGDTNAARLIPGIVRRNS